VIGLLAALALWVPAPGTTWQWQLDGRLDTSVPAQMYDVDLFDTPAATVARLPHPVCYLDAGTYEPGRPDSRRFPRRVLGRPVAGWPGERWLDIRSRALWPLLERRLDLCRAKGFVGVEADNVDGYANHSGFRLSAADQLLFNRRLARAAHRRGLSIGLKNDVEQAAALEPAFDWALDEQCYQYAECGALAPFVRAGKAVFEVEYSGGCPAHPLPGLMTMRKRLSLDAWRQPCW
jgi:hypothetical protein